MMYIVLAFSCVCVCARNYCTYICTVVQMLLCVVHKFKKQEKNYVIKIYHKKQ